MNHQRNLVFINLQPFRCPELFSYIKRYQMLCSSLRSVVIKCSTMDTRDFIHSISDSLPYFTMYVTGTVPNSPSPRKINHAMITFLHGSNTFVAVSCPQTTPLFNDTTYLFLWLAQDSLHTVYSGLSS